MGRSMVEAGCLGQGWQRKVQGEGLSAVPVSLLSRAGRAWDSAGGRGKSQGEWEGEALPCLSAEAALMEARQDPGAGAGCEKGREKQGGQRNLLATDAGPCGLAQRWLGWLCWGPGEGSRRPRNRFAGGTQGEPPAEAGVHAGCPGASQPQKPQRPHGTHWLWSVVRWVFPACHSPVPSHACCSRAGFILTTVGRVSPGMLVLWAVVS